MGSAVGAQISQKSNVHRVEGAAGGTRAWRVAAAKDVGHVTGTRHGWRSQCSALRCYALLCYALLCYDRLCYVSYALLCSAMI